MDTPQIIEDMLKHHGVKGMKWGVRRKATVGPREVVVRDSRKKLKTSGGKAFPAHADAVRARTVGQKGKGSGLKALSDAELSMYAKRLRLEQDVKRLNYNEKNVGQKFVANFLGQSGKTTTSTLGTEAGTQAAKKIIKLAAVAA